LISGSDEGTSLFLAIMAVVFLRSVIVCSVYLDWAPVEAGMVALYSVVAPSSEVSTTVAP